MKRIIAITVICLTLSLFVYSISLAQYEASTTMPEGALNVTITGINSQGTTAPADDDWTDPGAVTVLDFGPLEEVSGVDPVTGRPWIIFLPTSGYYFAIDVGFAGGGAPGVGTINVTITDNLGPDPLGPGLGDRASVTLARTYFATAADFDANITTDEFLEDTKLVLADVGDRPVLVSEISGGWLRMYVGIITLDPAADPPYPAGAVGFNPTDPAGPYSATINISYL